MPLVPDKNAREKTYMSIDWSQDGIVYMLPNVFIGEKKVFHKLVTDAEW